MLDNNVNDGACTVHSNIVSCVARLPYEKKRRSLTLSSTTLSTFADDTRLLVPVVDIQVETDDSLEWLTSLDDQFKQAT
jgi:hypothetical protein